MLEVEVRYRTEDRADVISRLLAWGATLTQDRTDVDLYFRHPNRDLKARDESFRLRRIGERNYLTYKGPRRDAEIRARTEIEVPISDGDTSAHDTQRLLQALGFEPLVVVRKHRVIYSFSRSGFPIEICFDDLERVGQFVELEILAQESEYEPAKSTLLQTATELGLIEKENRSYLGMTLAAMGNP